MMKKREEIFPFALLDFVLTCVSFVWLCYTFLNDKLQDEQVKRERGKQSTTGGQSDN